MNIRSAVPEDYINFRNMAKNCSPLDIHTPYTYWVVGQFFSEGCFLLEDNEKIVGSIMTVTKDDTVFIWQIAILAEYRGKGLSDMLYEAVYNYAKGKGIERIMLSIDPSNLNSLSAFRRFCEKRQLNYRKQGTVDINIPEEAYTEYENIYEIYGGR